MATTTEIHNLSQSATTGNVVHTEEFEEKPEPGDTLQLYGCTFNVERVTTSHKHTGSDGPVEKVWEVHARYTY